MTLPGDASCQEQLLLPSEIGKERKEGDHDVIVLSDVAERIKRY